MTAAISVSTLFDGLAVTGAGSVTSLMPEQRPRAVTALRDETFWAHLDVMDQAFAGRTGITVDDLPKLLARAYRSDVHLMVQDPAAIIGQIADMSPTRITFHFETAGDPRLMSKVLRSHSVSPWLAISPRTPVSEVQAVIDHFDGVLVMLLEPGSTGTAIRSRAAAVHQLHSHLQVGVDGGVDATNLDLWIQSGATYIVAGRALLSTV